MSKVEGGTVNSSIASSTVYPGDIVYFPRSDAVALVAVPNATVAATRGPAIPSRVDLIWLNYKTTAALGSGELPGDHARTSAFPHEVLDQWIAETRAEVIATGVSHPQECRPDLLETGRPIDPNNVGPRCPAAAYSVRRVNDRSAINAFLTHPLVEHPLGSVAGMKAAFAAERPDGRWAAVVVVEVVTARVDFDRQSVEITRYASHPVSTTDGTDNTASWLLERAVEWAALEGYERVKTYAGTAGNDGGIYRAANFTAIEESSSTGTYDRSGRADYDHDRSLIRYERYPTIGVDHEATTLPRRVEARVDRREEQGFDLSQRALTDRHGTQTATAPSAFRLGREYVTSGKLTRTVETRMSRECQALCREVDGTIPTAATLEEQSVAGIFSALANETVIAAMLVQPDGEIARVTGFTTRETVYPDRTFQWLLNHVEKWAELAGYDQVQVKESVYIGHSTVSAAVPKSLQWSRTNEETWVAKLS